MIELPAAHIEHPQADRFTVLVPDAFRERWVDLASNPNVKASKQLYVRIEVPLKPISKGKRSQINRIHGHCGDLAFQLNRDEGTSVTTADVKAAMKRIAVGPDYNYPTEINEVDGVEEPLSLSKASMHIGNIFDKVIQDFADKRGYWLTEYDEHEVPYKSLYGKSREEMRRDFPQVNGD